jgi:hypothetical protein
MARKDVHGNCARCFFERKTVDGFIERLLEPAESFQMKPKKGEWAFQPTPR